MGYRVASSYQDALNEIALTSKALPVKSGLYHFLGGKSAVDISHYQNACHWLAYLGSRFVAISVLLLSFLGSAFAADHAVILLISMILKMEVLLKIVEYFLITIIWKIMG